MGYNPEEQGVFKGSDFALWLDGLRDLRARARIQSRINRAAEGNLGDVKSLGGGLGEMRIDCGPGYRLYFTGHPDYGLILLTGGTKATQIDDVHRARAIAANLKEEAR